MECKANNFDFLDAVLAVMAGIYIVQAIDDCGPDDSIPSRLERIEGDVIAIRQDLERALNEMQQYTSDGTGYSGVPIEQNE